VSSNRREFSRAHLSGLVATLYTDEDGRLDCNVDDVSLGGVHVVLQSRVVARRDATGVGLRLDSVDEETFAHLRRLVMLNAEDPDQVEAEIDQHLGIRPHSGTNDGAT
jgi:hypothetical protein